ncbi:interferon-induced 35 kDa protein [Denticeps clupeoides]|uniref:RRM domain-containing protein n=1 Tax=Denticeps clupeoides TaxID=299321 RepID=A0AAY4D2C4_9TELE|nr:interferon-induced 35 kDa protein [Denticeps clupeoides]XP_028842180.1 interferon-induced 35 kDa protein [Denticeps clupeoides]XP_028842181.1 interferon-induced 35 kDa protein [Denticeps clupeoides]
MSSDEDFSLMDQDPHSELDRIRKEVDKLKAQHDRVIGEQRDLNAAQESLQHYTQEFNQRAAKIRASLQDEEKKRGEHLANEQGKVGALMEENSRLTSEITRLQQASNQLDQQNLKLRQQTEVSTAVPEKRVVFTGEAAQPDKSREQRFDMKSRIVYPMEGGSTLITFEDDAVAQHILTMKQHKVPLDGSIALTMEASPVYMLVPDFVMMDTQVCPRRILVSSLPKREEERTMDKLQIHFSRKKNGGGEVEDIDMLHDSGNVVITFVESDIARGLTDKQDHDVEFEKGKKWKVKVTPFLNGEITSLRMRNSMCQNTVLLTGIPPIMEPDNLQDLLEIHFQKTSSGGGEVDAILYNPIGHRALAVFEDASKGTQSQ